MRGEDRQQNAEQQVMAPAFHHRDMISEICLEPFRSPPILK